MEQNGINVADTNSGLSRGTLIAYGAGDFASNLCWTFVGGYLTIFYTDILGIAPAMVSLLLLVARVFDGFWDPAFGAIAERTKSRWGRFRPYIMFGAPALAIFSTLTFTKIGNGNITVIAAFVTYFICGLMYSVVNMSYGSLSTVMTSNQDSLMQLNSYRMLGSNISTLLLNALTPSLLLALSRNGKLDAHGYMMTALVFACCALPLFYLVAFKCHENIQPDRAETNVPLRKTLRVVLTNKPLMTLFVLQLIAMTAMFGRFGVLAYYVMYDLKRFDLLAWFMTLPSVGTVLGILLTKNYVTKVGRKKMTAIGYIGSGSCLLAMFLIGQLSGYQNVMVLLVLNCLFGFFNFALPIPMAMIADAINYGEDKFGVRADGTSYSTFSISTKLGSAFGASLGLMYMGLTGYVANQQQTVSAMTGINVATNLMTAVLWLLSLIPLFIYPLTEKVNDEINERLAKKRKAA